MFGFDARMTAILIAALIGNVIVWGGTIWFFWAEKIKSGTYSTFKKDHYIRAFIFSPNKQVSEYNTLFGLDNIFNFDSGSYIVDKKRIYFMGRFGRTPCGFYEYGNPNPLGFENIIRKFKGQKIPESELNTPDIDAANFKRALETKFIRDLMQEKKVMLVLFILVGINLLLSAAIAASEFGLMEKLQKGGG